MNDDEQVVEVEVFLSEDDAAAVAEAAERRGETPEDLIRDAIRERLLEVDGADSPRTSPARPTGREADLERTLASKPPVILH